MPKPNGYHSLHTTVFCLDNKLTEFQIRTKEMHDEAENGIAAHWAYEETKGNKSYRKGLASFADKKELAWVYQLRNWQKDFSNSEEFLRSLKIDFFKDRIFVITPKGEVVDLPADATPVDFAYAIHTEIGDQCVGARINNKLVPLDHKLQSGDLVEILVQKSKKPSESWLQFVKTVGAKKKIKSAIKGSLRLHQKFNMTEFKIVSSDKIGLLKDISTIFSRNHINISSTVTTPNPGYRSIKITCELSNKEKAEKLILKLKKIKEIKEISYKVV